MVRSRGKEPVIDRGSKVEKGLERDDPKAELGLSAHTARFQPIVASCCY